jgi:MFS family permease
VLFVSRGIEGIGLMVVSTCGPTAVVQCVAPRRQGLAMGLWSNWGAIGGAIGMAATPFIWLSLGYTWVWSIFIGMAVIAALLVLLFVDDPQSVLMADSEYSAAAASTPKADPGPEAAASVPEKSVPTPLPKKASTARYRDVLTRDSILVLYAFVCFSLGLLALLSYLPSVLQLQGFAPERSAFPITLIQLLSIICVPLCGALSDKLGRSKPLLVATFFIFGFGLFLMFTNTGPLLWAAAVLQGIVGFSCIGLFLVAWAEVLPRPELISIGMAVFVLVQSLGQFLGSALAQALLGPDLSNWTLTGICLFAIIASGAVALLFSRFR